MCEIDANGVFSVCSGGWWAHFCWDVVQFLHLDFIAYTY